MTELPTTFTDNFDGDVFDIQWGEDEPNPATGTVSLDTVNDYAHFASAGDLNMWTLRQNAPILWVAAPDGNYFIETHVMMGTLQETAQAGLTVYSGDGARPNFIFCLNHWGAHGVLLQGLQDNNPNVSTSATGGEAWLRLHLLRDAGAGGLDRYVCQYKLNVGDPWSILTTYDIDVANARAGLVFKTDNSVGKTADFSYAAVGELDFGVGDAIKLDFCQNGDGAGGSLADWNQIANGGGDIPVGRVVRHGDGAIVDGASITLSNYQAGRVDDNANCNNWPPVDPYYIPAADDIYWHGVAADFSTTFNVDPRFAYDVRIYALISDNPGYTERFVVTGENVQTVEKTRGQRWVTASLEASGMVFNSVIPNASGQIIFTLEDVTNAAYPLNAIVLEAQEIPRGTLFLLR
jgi:hypothetical protein